MRASFSSPSLHLLGLAARGGSRPGGSERPVESEGLGPVVFVSTLPSELTCPLCLDFVWEPTCLTECGHVFCGACLTQVRSRLPGSGCPSCRQPDLDSTCPSYALRSLANNRRVYCRYGLSRKADGTWIPSQSKGFCQEKPMLHALLQHEANCAFSKQTKCPVENCTFVGLGSDMEVHLASCAPQHVLSLQAQLCSTKSELAETKARLEQMETSQQEQEARHTSQMQMLESQLQEVLAASKSGAGPASSGYPPNSSGPRLLVGLSSGRIALLNLATWETEKIFQRAAGGGAIECLGRLGNNEFVSTCGSGAVSIWNLNGSMRMQWDVGYRIDCLAVLQSGGIVTAGECAMLQIWSQDGLLYRTLTGHDMNSSITNVLALSDGRLASSSYDEVIHIWNSDGTLDMTLSGHQGAVASLAELPSGFIVSASSDGMLKKWCLQSRACQQTLHSSGAMRLLAMDNDRVMVLAATGVMCWNTKSGNLRDRTDIPTPIQAARVVDSTYVCVCADGLIRMGTATGIQSTSPLESRVPAADDSGSFDRPTVIGLI